MPAVGIHINTYAALEEGDRFQPSEILYAGLQRQAAEPDGLPATGLKRSYNGEQQRPTACRVWSANCIAKNITPGSESIDLGKEWMTLIRGKKC
ncbi:hypothetical protein E2562_016306 [Oryza meyeriana var. granulata]|uniref:Uncharacterized protein n=1 Tax=Oryza meyeriana var. granulata TaxID=110450 RepID=A0A6G1DY27_9ORYZ|nr:hypothetical protein E2562_016306 [Oryza meyeriana var. granulata]